MEWMDWPVTYNPARTAVDKESILSIKSQNATPGKLVDYYI